MTSVPMSSSSSASAVSCAGSRANGFSTSDGTPARASCRANAGWVLEEVATTTPSSPGSSSIRSAPAVTAAAGPGGTRLPASSDGASGCSAAETCLTVAASRAGLRPINTTSSTPAVCARLRACMTPIRPVPTTPMRTDLRSFRRARRLLDDEDGDVGVEDEGLRDTAQQRLADRRAAPGADHQELGVSLVGELENGGRRVLDPVARCQGQVPVELADGDLGERGGNVVVQFGFVGLDEIQVDGVGDVDDG